MLTLLFLLKFPVLWSFLGDHSILLHSFPFTNTIKCKIGVFKPDSYPLITVPLFQKTRKEVKLKLRGEHMHVNQFAALSSTLNLQGAPEKPVVPDLLPGQRDSTSASAPGEWNSSQGTGSGSAGCAAPEGPGLWQRSLGRRCS